MKKYILLVGVLGIFSLFAGCSDDNSNALAPVDGDDTATESSSSVKASSGNESKDMSSSSEKPSSSDGKAKPGPTDTTTIHQQVYVTDSGTLAASSYVSSGIFCWTEGCEAQFASSSSAASSSSEKIIIEVSSESSEPPEINGDRMTDKRDGKSYKLQNVAGKMWMAQDLNYERSGSMCFNNEDANCTKYGRLYTFSSAQEACPAGWRLPNRNEAQAVINDESFPWSYSGRCKTGECDFTEKMGFHWTSATPQDGDKNYGEKTGEIAVIIVEKEPSYAGEETPKFFQVDEKPKYFSVRCVQE